VIAHGQILPLPATVNYSSPGRKKKVTASKVAVVNRHTKTLYYHEGNRLVRTAPRLPSKKDNAPEFQLIVTIASMTRKHR
jgi:hypothetical protein